MRTTSISGCLGFFLIFKVQGDINEDPAFLFPSTSNASDSNIWSQIMRNHDRIVVEWTDFLYTPAVHLELWCKNSVELAMDSQASIDSVGPLEDLANKCTIPAKSYLEQQTRLYRVLAVLYKALTR